MSILFFHLIIIVIMDGNIHMFIFVRFSDDFYRKNEDALYPFKTEAETPFEFLTDPYPALRKREWRCNCTPPKRNGSGFILALVIIHRRIHHLHILIVKAKKVIIPSYRFDITNNYDLVEEVSRIYGFDNIPEVPLDAHYSKPCNKLNINEKLVTLGYKEVINFTFISRNYMKNTRELKLENPISMEKSVMRESLIPGLLSNIAYNANRKHKSINIFERGKTYHRDKSKIIESNKHALSVVVGN